MSPARAKVSAYFVTLNSDMQLELIERAEYGI